MACAEYDRLHSAGCPALPRASLKESITQSGASARDGKSGVVLKHLRLAAFIPDALGFQGNIGFQTDCKASAIGEIHLEVWAITAILEDGANANDLSSEFFAFNHGLTRRSRVMSEQERPMKHGSGRTQVATMLEHITLIVCRLIVVKDKP